MRLSAGQRNLLLRLLLATGTFCATFCLFALLSGGIPVWILEIRLARIAEGLGPLAGRIAPALATAALLFTAFRWVQGTRTAVIGDGPAEIYSLGTGTQYAFKGEIYHSKDLRKRNSRVAVSADVLYRHLHCIGGSGSGKTVSVLQNLAVQHILKGGGLVVIDGKTDYDTVRLLAWAAEKAGRQREFHLFDLADERISETYNPLIHGSPSEIAEKILSTFDFSDVFYEQRQRMAMYAFIDAIVGVREITRKPFNFRDILWILYYIPHSLRYLRELLSEIPEARDAREQLRMLEIEPLKALMEQTAGVRSLMHRYSYALPSPVRINSYAPDIDMEAIIRNHEIAYFSLNSMTYQKTAYCTARLVLQDIQAVAGKFQYEIKSSKLPFLIFMDEAGEYLYDSFETFLKQSRSAGFGCVIMHQAMGDLKKVRLDFTSQVTSNTETKAILKINDPSTREWISKALGKMIVKRRLDGKSYGHVFESVDGVIPRSQERTIETEDAVIRPEMLAALSAGTGYLAHGSDVFRVRFDYHENLLSEARRIKLGFVERRWAEETGSGMNIDRGLKRYLRENVKDLRGPLLDEMEPETTPAEKPLQQPSPHVHKKTA